MRALTNYVDDGTTSRIEKALLEAKREGMEEAALIAESAVCFSCCEEQGIVMPPTELDVGNIADAIREAAARLGEEDK